MKSQTPPPILPNGPSLCRPFFKMHGAGNDFVVLDTRSGAAQCTPALAAALGHRNCGVGFDQLAEIRPSDAADFHLDFWNSDGTRAGACGNATRCVSHYMMAQLGRDDLRLTTQRGMLFAQRGADGQIAVNMGPPQLDWRDLPLARDVDMMNLPLAGGPVAVGMGNPHAVFFVPDAGAVDLAARGPALEHDALFPARCNIEFASLVAPDTLRLRVWERGAGITLACGSGTCAAVVAAHLRGLTGRRVRVQADGGTLAVDWREDGVWLTGPVAYVFSGTLSPEFMAQHT
jgi:diaminopimelate epimerase